jgi:acyl CoA:acetate/3-ketoacid CoA transferase
LPFLPSRGAIGTDLVGQNPENLRLVDDPFGSKPVIACRALVPDVALIHAHRADRFGNIQYDPTAMWPDIGIMPRAAKRVIVSAEEIVDTEVLRRHPERTILPGFVVDAVVEAPYGAHPTSFFPNYGYDSRFHREWAAASRDDEAADEIIRRYVLGPASQQEYLNAVGGEDTLRRIREWEEGG